MTHLSIDFLSQTAETTVQQSWEKKYHNIDYINPGNDTPLLYYYQHYQQ